MHRTTLIHALVILLLSGSFAHALDVDLKITGLDKEMEKNAQSYLTLYSLKDNRNLSVVELKRLHRKGSEQIRRSLRPFGYYHAEVTPEIILDDDTWRASYQVKLGDPVIVEKLEIIILGDGKQDDVLLQAIESFPLQEGVVMNQRKYENGKKRLVQQAYSQGYLDTKIFKDVMTEDGQKTRLAGGSIQIHRKNRTAEIQLVLDTFGRYYFGETLPDKEILVPEILKKFIDYEEGEPYTAEKKAILQRSLYKTGYFKYVNVRGNVAGAVDHRVPVTIELEPTEHMNKYTFGAGFATDTGLRGKIGWQNRLFNRRGHTLRSDLEVAQRRSEFSLFYGIPVLNPRYDSHLLGATYSQQEWEETTTKLLALGATLNHDGPRFKYGVSVEARDEDYDVGVTDGEVFLFMPSLHWGVIFADSLAKTGMGIKLWANLRGANSDLFSDVSFLQGDAGAKAIISPFPNWRVIGRINMGATWVDDIEDLPPSLRYYTGGDQTVRGYRYKEIGERDSSGTLVGGRYLLVESIEVEREINDIWSVAAFWDGGKATDDLSSDNQEGVGVGVRIRLPFGQIRLDLASAISEEDNPFRFHLNVGGDL